MSDLERLKELLKQVKRSHPYLLKNMIIRENAFNEGNYSDKLKHAILVQEQLDKEK